jgi:undecaprenyl-phosphate 4-deoxy-4-formamido-L-arabinose transferase
MNLSIIVPVYNSAKILKILVKKIKKNLRKINYEIIFINDASLDNSWTEIKKISKKNKKIKGINLSENFGQHSAIFAGLKFAKGKKIITMDDDLQHPPESIKDMISKLNKYDLCYTTYMKRKHVFWKRSVSWINNIFSSFLFDKPIDIYLSSFRGFNKKISNQIVKDKNPIIFIDGLLLKYAKKICTIKVKHKKRLSGYSNYKFKNLFSLWFDMILNYHFYPIRIGSFIGLFSKAIILLIRILSNKNKIIQYRIKETSFRIN